MRSRKAAKRTELLVFLAAAALLAILCAVAAHAQIVEEKKDPTTTIQFSENGVTVTPQNPYAVWVEPGTSKVTILQKGSYLLTGSSSEGQVIVDLSKKKKVELELAGLDLQSSAGPVIWAKNAEKLTVILASKTVNRLTDSLSYSGEATQDEDANACLYATCDLEIKGTGALSVEGNYRNGIRTKADLAIKKAMLVVSAPYIGLRGNTVNLQNATVELDCYTYGVLARSKKPERGWVNAEQTSLSIEAGMVGVRTSGNLNFDPSCMVQINSETPIECEGEANTADLVSQEIEEEA